MKQIVLFIDPQSINSLATYDYCSLENIKDIDIRFLGNEKYNGNLLNKNVAFIPIFKYGRYSKTIFKGISYFRSIINIVIYAIKERPAIAHFQWIRVWWLDWLLIKLLKTILRINIIFTVHNNIPHNINNSLKLKRKYINRFSKLYKFCDNLITHTDTSKSNLIDKFKLESNQITVMPHGVIQMNVSDKDLNISKNIIDKKYKLSGQTIFGSLGIQSYYKGADLLIKAWINDPEISNRKDIILLIAGKLSGINIPEVLPPNVIIIPELLSNSDFKYLLLRTDVMMLPYREIEQSGVLLSLISEHKPYCCTNVGELNYPLKVSNIGWEIKSIDDKAISDTIKYILSHKHEIDIKKNNIEGWAKLNQMYSWDKSNQILRKLYKEILTKLDNER